MPSVGYADAFATPAACCTARYDIEAAGPNGYTDLGFSDECDTGALAAQWVLGGTTAAGSVSFLTAPATPIADAATRPGSYLLQSTTGAYAQIGFPLTIGEGEQVIIAVSGASAEGAVSANEARLGVGFSSLGTGFNAGTHDWYYWDGGNEDWDHWNGSLATTLLGARLLPPLGDVYFRLMRPTGSQLVYIALSMNKGRSWTKIDSVNTVTRGHTHVWVFSYQTGLTDSLSPGILEISWVRHIAFDGSYDPWPGE